MWWGLTNRANRSSGQVLALNPPQPPPSAGAWGYQPIKPVQQTRDDEAKRTVVVRSVPVAYTEKMVALAFGENPNQFKPSKLRMAFVVFDTEAEANLVLAKSSLQLDDCTLHMEPVRGQPRNQQNVVEETRARDTEIAHRKPTTMDEKGADISNPTSPMEVEPIVDQPFHFRLTTYFEPIARKAVVGSPFIRLGLFQPYV